MKNNISCFVKQALARGGSVLCGFAFAGLISVTPQPGSAQTVAQCAKQAAGCVVNVAKSAYYAVSTVGGALEFAALHANCVADVTSGNPVTIGVTSAIVGIAASGLISSSSSDACKGALYGVAARPLASALSEIIKDDKLKSFASTTGSEVASDGFEAIASGIFVPSPGAPTLSAQLVCGCAVAAAGAGLIDNLKNMLVATAAAADVCTGAMGCLGAATLNAIADVGKAVGKVSVAVAKCAWTPNDCGETEAIPPAQYWTYNFAPFVPIYADLIVTEANTYCGNNSIYEYKPCTPAQELENKRNECLGYHTAHKASADTARAVCNPMRDRVINEAQVIVNRRMADEVFPKKALAYVKATFPLEGSSRYQTGAFAFCNPPKDPNKSTGVDLTGASYYTGGSESNKVSSQCIDAVLRSIGVDRSNGLVINTNVSGVSLLADAKSRAQKANWNFVDTFTAAYTNWEPRLNAIKNNYQTAVLNAAKNDSVFLALNAQYAKSARDVYVAGLANCPKAGVVGQLTCIKDMRSYMGMQQNYPAQSPADGYIDFSSWGTSPPKPYASAMSLLEKVKAQKGNVSEATSGAVAWAMEDATKALAMMPAKAVAAEKLAQKSEREKQTVLISRAQDELNDVYVLAKSRCKQTSCGPKIDDVRQTEKVSEGDLLKKLVIGTGSEVPFRGLDSYLAGMKALEVATRPKYKSVLDQEIFILGPNDTKRLGTGVALVGTTNAGGTPIVQSPAGPGTVAVLSQQGGAKGFVDLAPKQGVVGNTGPIGPPGPIGMPSLPKMTSTPFAGNKIPGAVDLGVANNGKSGGPAVVAANTPGAGAGVVAVVKDELLKPGGAAVTPPVPGGTPPVAAVTPPVPGGTPVITAANAAALGSNIATKLPFDPVAYRKEREKSIGDEWYGKCGSQPQCLQRMAAVSSKLIDTEIMQLKTGSPDHSNKAAVTAFQNSLDGQFDPQFKAAIPAMVAAPIPNTNSEPLSSQKNPKLIKKPF